MKDRVLKYIDILNKENYGEWKTSPKDATQSYFSYTEDVLDFIKDFYRSKYVDHDYMKTYRQIKDKDISTLNKKEVCALLTAFVRGDRFSEGFLNDQLKNGRVMEVLLRLKELNEI